MCGIIGYFKKEPTEPTYLVHRGPDEQTTKKLGKSTFCFSRLSINDMSDNGSQPFVKDGKMVVVVASALFTGRSRSYLLF